MMTLNASIRKDEQGQFKVKAYKEMRCPACDRLLFESNSGVDLDLGITCSRCKARWRIEKGGFTLVRPPKRLNGKLLDNWEKFSKAR